MKDYAPQALIGVALLSLFALGAVLRRRSLLLAVSTMLALVGISLVSLHKLNVVAISGVPVTLVALIAVGFAVLALRVPRPGEPPTGALEGMVPVAVLTGIVPVLLLLLGRRLAWGKRQDETVEAMEQRQRFWRWSYLLVAIGYGLNFLELVRRASLLPVTRGSHVIMRHEMIRAGSLASGVVFLTLVLGALLPLVLDGMERAGFARFVGARHIRATKSGFLSTIAVLSILGVAFSSCALGSVISIMGGFGQDLKRKILANNAHVVVDTPTPKGFAEWQPVLDRIKQAPGVVAATPMINSEVMASVGSNMSGVLIRGIDVATVGDVIDLPKNVELGQLEWLNDPELVASLPWSERRGVEPDETLYRVEDPKKTPSELPFMKEKHEPSDPAVEKAARPQLPPDRPVYPCIVIGRELAKTLHLRLGSEVSLVSRMGELTPAGVIPRERKFRVAGIFFSGMYEYDATHGYITLDAARDFFDERERIGAIQVKVVDSEKAELFHDGIATAAGRPDELRIRDWKEINKNLFSALKLERIATFIVLSLAIIVASFCILCTLLLMVTEKGREIAILKALGASDMAILRVFMVEGMIIGSIGTVFGVATGYAVCYGLSWFGVRIDPDVYYIDRLPIAVNAWDFAAVTGAALLICAISTLYPARAASKLLPVEGLRYE
jgi:lipoprotein-releasing system permease protein